MRAAISTGEEGGELDLADAVAAQAPGAGAGEAGEAAGRDQQLPGDLENGGAGAAAPDSPPSIRSTGTGTASSPP